MKDKDLLKLLIQNGWQEKRQHGSHHILEKNGVVIPIPIHGKDIGKGLATKILKQAGLK